MIVDLHNTASGGHATGGNEDIIAAANHRTLLLVGSSSVRLLLVLLLSLGFFASDTALAECERTDCISTIGLQAPRILRDAYAQQRAQRPPEQTFSPQTYSPQTYSPQTYSTPGYKPQSNSEQPSQPRPPRRRVVKCIIDNDPDDYCSFYSYHSYRSGSPCSCDGTRGTVY